MMKCPIVGGHGGRRARPHSDGQSGPSLPLLCARPPADVAPRKTKVQWSNSAPADIDGLQSGTWRGSHGRRWSDECDVAAACRPARRDKEEGTC